MRHFGVPNIAAMALCAGLLAACATPPPTSSNISTSSTPPQLIEPGPGGIIYETPSGAPTSTATPDEEELEEAQLQENLANVLPAEEIPSRIGNVTEELGQTLAAEAYSWAVSVTNRTMYAQALWDSARAKKKPEGWEFSYFSEFMTPNAADQWLRVVSGGPLDDGGLEKVSSLVIIPAPLPDGATWLQPALQQWKYELISARIAEAKSDEDQTSRPIEFTIKASAIGSYMLNGNFYQFNVERNQTFVIVQSVDPSKPWVLLSWDVDPPVFSEAIEFGDAPPGVTIPTPVPTEISEGTPSQDPDFDFSSE